MLSSGAATPLQVIKPTDQRLMSAMARMDFSSLSLFAWPPPPTADGDAVVWPDHRYVVQDSRATAVLLLGAVAFLLLRR